MVPARPAIVQFARKLGRFFRWPWFTIFKSLSFSRRFSGGQFYELISIRFSGICDEVAKIFRRAALTRLPETFHQQPNVRGPRTSVPAAPACEICRSEQQQRNGARQ